MKHTILNYIHKKWKMLSVVLGCCLVVGIALPPTIHWAWGAAHPSSQSDYPELPPYKYPEGVDMMDFDFDFMADVGKLVVVCTVQEVLEPEKIVYTPDPGSADAIILGKSGITEVAAGKRPIKLKVNQVLKGEEPDKTIMFYQHVAADGMEPSLKQGDTMILFLKPYPLRDGYVMSIPSDGYYYLAADDKVYPARVDKNHRNLSGMSFGQFKQKIKDAPAAWAEKKNAQ